MKHLYVVGTADTKGEELDFVAQLLRDQGASVRLVDVGTRTAQIDVDVSNAEVAAYADDGAHTVLTTQDRGEAMAAMGQALAGYVSDHVEEIAGMIGLGGGGGTSIVSTGMQRLPYGIPKVMVSTLASGDVAPYVDISDIMMVPSITDIAGLNRISRIILQNAAHGLIGAAQHPPKISQSEKPAVGLTMFGVTTIGVTAVSELISGRVDPLIFHATGTGGRAMEKLVADGLISGLIDLTTTEVCDLLFGGVLPASPNRLDVVADQSIPYVGSAGALDMVNFWAPATVPAHYQDRLLYHHNPNVTLMRTSPEECQKLGEWIGAKLNNCNGPVRFLIPEKGFSALDIEGGAFWDPEANDAFVTALNDTLLETAARRVVTVPFHINQPEFAAAAAREFFSIFQS